jgi:preprotein translocase subunit SecF
VVFDRVRDNTGTVLKSGDMSYGEMVNLSMNQTLARSINTSLVAILPVFSVLAVGAYILGATTLQNYGLALFVGLMSGAYSSIFIASPLLAWMKEREPRFRELAIRSAQRNEHRVLSPAAAAQLAGAGAQRQTRKSATSNGAASSSSNAIQARARKQKRR